MASKASKNTISIIASCNGIAIVVKNATKAKTPTGFADRVERACKDAFALWPDGLNEKDFQRIHNQLDAFERENLPAEGRLSIITSVGLGLLDELQQLVKDPVKRSALGKIEDTLFRLHKYYDKRLDHWDEYVIATKAVDNWMRTQ